MLYNDYPLCVTVLRKSGGKYRHLCTLAPRSTTESDWWETDELFLALNSGFDYRVAFKTGLDIGFSFCGMKAIRLPAGRTNISSVM